jgi:cyclopropane-fatty-acyl-phospholipid synthase
VCRFLLQRFAHKLGDAPLRVELWNGMQLPPSSEAAVATIEIREPLALLGLIVNRSLRFGEAYASGAVRIHGDLERALEILFSRWPSKRPRATSAPRARRGVLQRARANARHHYDLGNDFYRLWLDEQLVYTCAYFRSPHDGLEQAQTAKLDYICRKLRLRPGDRVLEAGCGWGALARHMAARYGALVTACNVSREQIRYARERAQGEGLGRRLVYVEDDFRNVSGRYDVFVSVGMLEHVGRRHYPELGRFIDARLFPERGRGLLHFIGRNQPLPLNAWVRRRIFPDAYPPTLAEVVQRVLEPWDFSVLDVENLRLHYAATLAHWRRRFERHSRTIAAMYDVAFERAWRLYLASAQAAFATGWMQLFQVTFARARDNDVAWTRAGLYAEADDGAL